MRSTSNCSASGQYFFMLLIVIEGYFFTSVVHEFMTRDICSSMLLVSELVMLQLAKLMTIWKLNRFRLMLLCRYC